MESDKSSWVKTNHQSGKKRVLLNKEQSNTNLTQVALGFIEKNTTIENHKHPTMEEFFFILSGNGLFILESKSLSVSQNDIIRVPANCDHSIEAISDLEFLYWGISI
ncbi:MAG: cupin domain-containing protein [Bacteroidales bacterium]